MNKKVFAKSILSLQKSIFISLILGLATFVICVLIFEPNKFDNTEFEIHDGGQYGSTTVSFGGGDFFKYTDGEISLSVHDPMLSVESRKSHLYNKSLKYALYASVVFVMLSLLIPFIVNTQRLLIDAAHKEN